MSARAAKPTARKDRRVEKTRKALLGAFNGLFFERRYDRIKVADIVARADVGRSTFYEHFADKEEILTESIRGPFGALANAVDVEGDAHGILRTLDHFRRNQDQARLILSGAGRRAVARVLATMIDERLRARGWSRSSLPSRLVAIAVADAQLGTIVAWLNREAECSAAVLAESLRAMTRGMVGAA